MKIASTRQAAPFSKVYPHAIRAIGSIFGSIAYSHYEEELAAMRLNEIKIKNLKPRG